MAKKYRGSSYKNASMLEVTGVSELLNKIEAAGGKVIPAATEMARKSLEIIGENMNEFMQKHKATGDTLNSYDMHADVNQGDNTIKGVVGYDVKKGGLPAIFLDVGTPNQKGHFWKYYAVENTRRQVEQIQQETLNKILEDLK